MQACLNVLYVRVQEGEGGRRERMREIFKSFIYCSSIQCFADCFVYFGSWFLSYNRENGKREREREREKENGLP